MTYEVSLRLAYDFVSLLDKSYEVSLRQAHHFVGLLYKRLAKFLSAMLLHFASQGRSSLRWNDAGV